MRNTRSTRPKNTPCRTGWPLAIAALLLALLVPASGYAREGVSVQVEPQEVSVGGVLTYTISAHAEGNKTIKVLSDPEFDNSFRLQFTSDSPGITILNGHAQRSLKRIYRLRVSRAGEFSIKAPQVKLGDRVITPETQTIKVVEGAASARAPRGAQGSSRGKKGANASETSAFIEYHIDPAEKPYIGQQITLSYALFSDAFQNNISPHPPDEPSFDDFWVDDLSQDFAGQRQTIRRASGLVTRTNLRAYALFPLKAGSARIEPFEMDAIESSGFGRRQRIRLGTDAIDIQVRPLPANPPEAFAEGNVGQWQFEVTADRLNAKMGEPITVRVRAKGRGQVRRLSLPSLPAIDGVEVAGKRSNSDSTIEKGVVGGTLTDEYTLVAQREGKVLIPALEFGYFDPIKERYQTQKSSEIPLGIKGGEVVNTDQALDEAPARAASTEDESAAQALVKTLDKPRDTISSAPSGPLFGSERIFWALLILPLFALLGLSLERPLRRRVLARRPRQGRAQSYKRALALLESASTQTSEDTADADTVLDAIRDAIHIYATEVAQIPAGDVSAAKLPEQLKKRGAPGPLAQRLAELLRAVQALRYSPGLESEHSPQEWLKICQDCLQELEKSRRAKGWSSQVLALVVGGLLLGASLGLPAQAWADPSPQSTDHGAAIALHNEALSAQEQGDWAKASSRWSEALKSHPDSVDILYNLGLAYAHQSDFGRARLYLERAAILSPGDRAVSKTLNTVEQMIRLEQVESARGGHQSSTRVHTTAEGLFGWSIATKTTRAALQIALLIFAWLLLIAQLIRRFVDYAATRNLMKIASWVLSLCILGVAGAWVARAQIVSTVRPAIIVDPDIALRDGPSQHAGLIELDTVVVPGIMLPTRSKNQGWVELSFAEDRVAWTRVEHIRYLNPDSH